MRKSKRTRAVRKASTRGKLGPQVLIRENVPNIAHPVAPPPKDMVEGRKRIADVVRGSAMGIIAALIREAEEGEVGPAKYLFEMVGLYPATEETSSKPEDSLAYTLLQRMGLPTELDGPEETQA
jgi:hypothetical protein